MKKTKEDLIKSCTKIMNEMNEVSEVKELSFKQDQMLSMARYTLYVLDRLNKGEIEKIGWAEMRVYIDCYDYNSDLWKEFRQFQDDNPDLFEKAKK